MPLQGLHPPPLRYRLATTDDVVGGVNFDGREAQLLKQVEARRLKLIRAEAETLHRRVAKDPGVDGEAEVERAGQRVFDLLEIVVT